MTDEQIDALMHDLTRPFYILRMAKAKIGHTIYQDDTPVVKSARKTVNTGREEVRNVLRKHGLLDDSD